MKWKAVFSIFVFLMFTSTHFVHSCPAGCSQTKCQDIILYGDCCAILLIYNAKFVVGTELCTDAWNYFDWPISCSLGGACDDPPIQRLFCDMQACPF